MNIKEKVYMDTDKTEEYIAQLAKKYPIRSRFSTLLDEIQSILIN